MEEIIRNLENHNDAYFYVCLFVLILCVVINQQVDIKRILAYPFSDRSIVRRGFVFDFILIFLATGLSLGLFAQAVAPYLPLKLTIELFSSFRLGIGVLISMVTSTFFFLKFTVLRLGESIYQIVESKYNAVYFFFIKRTIFLGIIAFIGAIFIYYTFGLVNDRLPIKEIVVFSIGAFLLVIHLVGLFRMMRYLKDKTRVPSYYIFLYLCSLEILPFFILTRYLIDNE